MQWSKVISRLDNYQESVQNSEYLPLQSSYTSHCDRQSNSETKPNATQSTPFCYVSYIDFPSPLGRVRQSLSRSVKFAKLTVASETEPFFSLYSARLFYDSRKHVTKTLRDHWGETNIELFLSARHVGLKH